MKFKTILIRAKIYADFFVPIKVRLNGKLPEYPHDIRKCIIHPEDFNKLKKFHFPKKLHRISYED